MPKAAAVRFHRPEQGPVHPRDFRVLEIRSDGRVASSRIWGHGVSSWAAKSHRRAVGVGPPFRATGTVRASPGIRPQSLRASLIPPADAARPRARWRGLVPEPDDELVRVDGLGVELFEDRRWEVI